MSFTCFPDSFEKNLINSMFALFFSAGAFMFTIYVLSSIPMISVFFLFGWALIFIGRFIWDSIFAFSVIFCF